MKYQTLLTVAILSGNLLFGQNKPNETSIKINRAVDPIAIDGKLTEKTWQIANRGGTFSQIFPTDSLPPADTSYFMLSYDDEFIYVALVQYDGEDQNYISQSLRRDFSWSNNDNISIYLDPFNDKTNGFAFQITPYNVQREGLVTIGGEVSDDWDNKWYSATSIKEGYWIAELAIPFKSIRYNSTPTWRMQVLRNNLKKNERSAWIHVPLQYRPSDLVYAGTLVWDQPPPQQDANISLIPYATYNINRDFEEGQDYRQSVNAGFDAKVGISNALNLDLTFNPDFSQVEVDRQVTNLNRFEIFFPERRQFFLENQDLFSQNGFPNARPFFSRRIGIGRNEDGLARQIPILGGARLSGKIGQNWRVGGLSMQTQADDFASQPSQNYSVGVFQRQVFDRSNVGAIIVNRQASNYKASDTTLNTTAYNRVVGIDYNLLSADNRWEGNFYYHQSFDPEQKAGTYSSGTFLQYRVREFSISYFQTLIGDNYNAEVGFVPRTGIFSFGTNIDYNFYPKKGPLQRHGPTTSYSYLTNTNFKKLDEDANISWEFSFLNTSYFELGINYNSIFLRNSFDPTNTNGEELPANERYSWFNSYVLFSSDDRKLFNYFVLAGYGGFYNGDRFNIRGNISYRYQPYVSLGISSTYNRLDFPSPYNSTDFYLIGPRLDLTLSTNVFFTTFVQYNNQIDNLNVNSRFQWRFKPVSDLFIVYTDNYNTEMWGAKNRALIVKLSYWFNI